MQYTRQIGLWPHLLNIKWRCLIETSPATTQLGKAAVHGILTCYESSFVFLWLQNSSCVGIIDKVCMCMFNSKSLSKRKQMSVSWICELNSPCFFLLKKKKIRRFVHETLVHGWQHAATMKTIIMGPTR